MTKLSKTLQLPVKLVDLVKQHFHTDNTSKAIRLSIESAILHNLPELQKGSLKRYHILNIEGRRTLKAYTVRLDSFALDAVCTVTSKSVNEAVTDALVITLSQKAETVPRSLKIINILGSKWDNRMQSAIKQILDTTNCTYEKTIEPCVGALGIHANFKIANTEVINDDDIEKINLYRCIKENAFEFKAKVLLFECTKTAFEELKTKTDFDSKIPNVDRAVRFFILNYFSVRNSGNTYTEKSRKKFYEHLEVVAPLSKRLQNAHISNIDIFDIIKKHKKDTNTLFIVDPIYLDTNVYTDRTIVTKTEHGKDFGWNEHKRLAKMLRSIKGDFIYFCRTTATRHKNKKHELLETPEAIRRKDIEMHGRIDDLYWGYGFYYIDVPLDNGTIERIITSFEFEGSTPYSKPTESEVQ